MKDGSELTPELLLQAYASGIFPMAESQTDTDVFWVEPAQRGIIPLNGFHISRSLRKVILSEPYQLRFDVDFEAVVTGCAARPETWINDTIFDLYRDLFSAGYAHSQEVWDGSELIGGVYGVALGSAFFGESMFSRQPNASKIALAYLIDRLKLSGFTLFDTQFVTDHLLTMGAIEIDRQDYLARLEAAIHFPAEITLPIPQRAYDVIQRNTQMS